MENAPAERESSPHAPASAPCERAQDAPSAPSASSTPSSTPAPPSLPALPLFDMHCHLDFAPNPAQIAREGANAGIRALSATVAPRDYERACATLASYPSVQVGLGMHPWWIAEGRCDDGDVALFEHLAPSAPLISEIGLDFTGTRNGSSSRLAQTRAFERALAAFSESAAKACGASPKIISLHAPRAARDVLDALERFEVPSQHICIFHWFSDSFDQLQRACALGCYFSVGPRMLATKRGRAYAAAIPLDRLLLETDEPAREGCAWSADAWRDSLTHALEAIAHLRALPTCDLHAAVSSTSARLVDVAFSRGLSL